MCFSFKKFKLPSKKSLFITFFVIYMAIVLPVLIINFTLIIAGNFSDEEYPDVFGYRAVVIEEDDMSPVISSGDLVFFKETDSSKINKDDIICFKDNTSIIPVISIKRVFGIDNNLDTTSFFVKNEKGVKNPFSVIESDVLGVQCLKISGAGNFVKFVQSKAGFVVFAIIPTLVFFALDMALHFNFNFKGTFQRFASKYKAFKTRVKKYDRNK